MPHRPAIEAEPLGGGFIGAELGVVGAEFVDELLVSCEDDGFNGSETCIH